MAVCLAIGSKRNSEAALSLTCWTFDALGYVQFTFLIRERPMSFKREGHSTDLPLRVLAQCVALPLRWAAMLQGLTFVRAMLDEPPPPLEHDLPLPRGMIKACPGLIVS